MLKRAYNRHVSQLVRTRSLSYLSSEQRPEQEQSSRVDHPGVGETAHAHARAFKRVLLLVPMAHNYAMLKPQLHPPLNKQ